MRRALSRAAVLMIVLGTAACQRPTQLLPPAPLFEAERPVDDQAGNALRTDPDDALSGADTDGILPGSVEDFLRHAGTDKVLFAYDSAELTAGGQATLDRQAEWLRNYPEVRISLEGHADERGTREYNFALGERRAAAMKLHLGIRGIAAERMATTSFGKEQPIVPGSDEESRAQNRRGETVLLNPAGAK